MALTPIERSLYPRGARELPDNYGQRQVLLASLKNADMLWDLKRMLIGLDPTERKVYRDEVEQLIREVSSPMNPLSTHDSEVLRQLYAEWIYLPDIE
jgi:hypothetical protein